jgi:hypothetical protein
MWCTSISFLIAVFALAALSHGSVIPVEHSLDGKTFVSAGTIVPDIEHNYKVDALPLILFFPVSTVSMYGKSCVVSCNLL